MNFRSAKNQPKIGNLGSEDSQSGISGEFQGGSAAEAVVLGGVSRAVLRVLGQVLGERLTRLVPPSKDGVGGFKG